MQTPPTVSKQFLNRPNAQPLKLEKAIPIHFIGAGGVGMSALAKILLEQGYTVSGSDAKESAYLSMLREYGGQFTAGHDAANLPDGAVVVASSAIDQDNPEVQKANQLGLPIFHRSDMLREILHAHEISIGLTGTHGKTTMTGMTGMVLEDGGLDPTILAGGKIPQLGMNAKAAKDVKYAVAELDESDGTVVQYRPTISVIANLEMDHPDHYQDGLEAVIRTFRQYLDALDKNHTVLFNLDCPVTRGLYREYRHRVSAIQVYTESSPADTEGESYSLQNVMLHLEGGYQADVYRGYDCIGSLWLQVPGKHNLWNALYAFIIGHRLGIPADTLRRTLENFKGMGRRFEQLGTYNKARVIDDYAHHPTEVKATLKAAREFNKYGGRVIAMFQPHRYQRLQALWDEFLEAFEEADEVIVLDVYAAGEAPIADISGQRFAAAMPHPAAEYWPSADWELVVARLKTMLTPDDLFITLGAGDVTQVGRLLVNTP